MVVPNNLTKVAIFFSLRRFSRPLMVKYSIKMQCERLHHVARILNQMGGSDIGIVRILKYLISDC